MMSQAHEPPEPPQLYAVPPPDHDFDTRTPPHDEAAERAVLGAMLADPTARDDATAVLTGTEYYRTAHELIHAAITHLHAAGDPVDVVTVTAHLEERGEIARAGGRTYIFDLHSALPAPATAAYYARIVADRAGRRALIEAGNRITQAGYATSGDDLDGITRVAQAELARAIDHRTTTTRVDTWAPINLDQYLFGDAPPEVPPTILTRSDGAALLYPGAVHTISGEPESGKSWFAVLGCAQQIADAHTVAYIDFEDRPARVLRRLLDAGAHPTQVAQHFRYIRPDVALAPGAAQLLATVLTDCTLIVLDGITEAMGLHGLSPLDNMDAATFHALLPRRLADTGAAVLQIDHVVKNPENRGRYAMGAQHKLAAIDGCAFKSTVTEPFGRGKRGHARITLDKDREGHVRELALGLTVATLTLDSRVDEHHDAGQLRIFLDAPSADTGEDGAFRPTTLMERVSRFVELNPGCTQTTIEQTVRGNAQHLRAAVRALSVEGFLRTEPAPRNATRHWSEGPFREEDDR
jgi:hypothetical protein